MMKQAAQQALEALLALHAEGARAGWHLQPKWEAQMRAASCGINALRAAIQQAEAQQPTTLEPVRLGALIALTAERNKLQAALSIACSYLTEEQTAQVAAAMPNTAATPEPVGYLYDFKYDDEIVRDWFTQNIDEIQFRPDTCLNIRPLYTHHAPGVPDDVARNAIATVREQYRGTDWGKAAECICDAIDAAMLAAK